MTSYYHCGQRETIVVDCGMIHSSLNRLLLFISHQLTYYNKHEITKTQGRNPNLKDLQLKAL